MAREVTTTLALKLSDKASRPMQAVMNRIDRTTNMMAGSLMKLTNVVRTMWVAYAGYKVVEKFTTVMTKGFHAVEDYQQKLINLSAFITTFSKKAQEGDIAQAYKEAKDYAAQLIVYVEKLDAQTIATGRDLSLMAETMIKNRVLLDTQNEAQAEGFIRIANALIAVTAGQNKELQIQQEINALLSGRLRTQDRLGKMLKSIDPQLKEHLELWKQQGTVIEEVGKLLKGFDPAAKDLEHTWEAIQTTMSTIIDQVLRGGFVPVYEDIIKYAESVKYTYRDQNGILTEQAEILQGRIQKTWLTIKNIVSGIASLLRPLEPVLELLGDLTLRVSDGWGMIAAIIPPIADRIGSLLKSMVTMVTVFYDFTMATWAGMSFDFKLAAEWANQGKEDWLKSGQEAGNAFRSGLIAEMRAGFAEYQAIMEDIGKSGKGLVPPPEMAADFAKVDESIKKANEELEKFYAKLDKDSKTAIDRITLMALPEYARGLEVIERKYIKVHKELDKWGKIAGKTTHEIAILHNELAKRIDEEVVEYVKSHTECTEQIDELWVSALDRVQSTLADTFMDAMKGELDSFEDVFEAFCDSILRYWAEMAAQMTMYDLFGVGKGAGGSGWGSFLGGVFGSSGVYGSGDPRSSNFVGPLQQGVQGASSAYSLYGAYGAYGQAGGGWGGLKAGAGSFFGGGTGSGGSGFAGMGAMGYTSWIAAIVYAAAQIFGTYNAKHGYGKIDGTPQGYDSWQPQNPLVSGNYFSNDWANDPARNFMRGKLGYKNPAQSDWFSYHMGEGNYWDAFLASGPAMAEWMDPIGSFIMNDLLGFDPGKFLGFSNKKRSYFGETYGFGDYSPDEGWGVSDWSHEWKDKRDGKKAFGEAGEGMAETAQGLMNALDSTFKDLLGTFDETQVNAFTTAMAELSAEMTPVTEATKGYQQLLEQGITEVPRMSFGYYIGAEDEDEFKDDWRESWKRVTANIIDPIVEIGSDFLNQALDGAVTDATAWNYFTDNMREYLRAGLTEGLEGLDVDWSIVTDQESLEAAFEQMGLAAEQIASIVGYFEQVGTVLENITSAIGMHEFSDNADTAIAGFRAINVEFEQYALTLESLGIDLEKYTDLEKAHLIVLQDESKALSDSVISGEDLALALEYVSEEMTEAGHTIEEIAAAMDAAYSGVLDSIEDIKQSAEDYDKTDLELMYEKHPEWQGMDYEQWAGTDLTDWSIEMLQEWRNLGELFVEQFDDLRAAIEDNTSALEDAQAEIIDKLEESINSFERATQAISDYQDSLIGSSDALSTEASYAYAGTQLDAAIQGLYSDDQDVILASLQSIPGLAEDFLSASKLFAGTPEQYMADFSKIMATLNAADVIGADWLVKLQGQLADLFLDEGFSGSGGSSGGGVPSNWPSGYDPSPYWPSSDVPSDVPGVYSIWNMGMASGGIISGPGSGYNLPEVTFHGTEYVIPGNQMEGVTDVLCEVKKLLVQVRDTNGDQNKTNKKLYRIIDRVSQGEEYLMTKAV